MTGGATALIWCIYIMTDAYIVQRLGREALERIPAETTTFSSPSPDGASLEVPKALSSPVKGAPLARLSIPRIGLSAVVLHGSDAYTLRLGPGHIENTPLPGESGNVAIAGHRDSFFRPLRNVHVGDDVLLDTPEFHIHYRVSSFRVVDSSDVSVIGPTKDATLTLVTCYPFYFIGHAPDRFIVLATRVEAPAATTSEAQTSEPTREPDVGHATNERDDGVPTEHDVEGTRLHKTEATQGTTSHVTRSIQSESVVHAVRRASDDKALVREAVDNFRVKYNAHLAHGSLAPQELMTFRFCEIAMAGTTANATCNASVSSPQRLSPPVWTVGLNKVGRQWTVTSIAMR